MRRILDLPQLERLAAQRHLTLENLARRISQTSSHTGDRASGDSTGADTPAVSLTGLEQLTAGQLVALADLLEVTVDELLRPADLDAPTPLSDRLFDAPRLGAALLQFGRLSEHAVLTALHWDQPTLDRAVADLHRTLQPAGLMIRRRHRRLGLATRPGSLTDFTRQAVASVVQVGDVLDHHDVPVLVTAIRAHLAGPYPGPPMVPWEQADDLAHQGAALPPEPYARNRTTRLRPHPDLLYALDLTDRPAPDPCELGRDECATR